MKNFQALAVAGSILVSTALPMTSIAQVRHKTLKTVGAGVAGYEVAKHSHNKFLMKHRKAVGIISAIAAHHYMKKHRH